MIKAVFAGSDYRDHDEIRAATSAWLRRRNAEARRDWDARWAARDRRRARRAVNRRRAA
jgi:hypothetical protein